MSLRDRLRRRAARWARARQGEDTPPVTLRSRRLYILPSRTGLYFALLLFVMLLAGLNYSSSLALFLTFLLAGFGLIAMYDCHRSLAGLIIAGAEAEDSFAHRHGTVRLWLDNPTALARRQLALRCPGQNESIFDLAARERREVALIYAAGHRGRQHIDRIELTCRGPLPFFRAWTWLHLPLAAVIYPQPQHLRPLPPPAAAPRTGPGSRVAGTEEEWAWLRAFNPGDSPRRVAWKAFARGAPLLVAHYDAPAAERRWLDYGTLSGLEPERRLSQLAQWLLECEQRGEAYGLRLPGEQIGLDLGIEHRRRCLTALALFGQREST